MWTSLRDWKETTHCNKRQQLKIVDFFVPRLPWRNLDWWRSLYLSLSPPHLHLPFPYHSFPPLPCPLLLYKYFYVWCTAATISWHLTWVRSRPSFLDDYFRSGSAIAVQKYSAHAPFLRRWMEDFVLLCYSSNICQLSIILQWDVIRYNWVGCKLRINVWGWEGTS